MRFPSVLDNEYLVYHRLTGLQGRSIEAVLQLVEEGFSLTPYDERETEYDEPSEMFGLDPIDVAAGDGGAIFCTPFKPFSPSVWGKAGFNQTPGVAFRLSDLLTCCAVSVRPRDYQVFYNDFIDRSALAEAFRCMTRSVVDIDAHAHYLDMLSSSLEILRSAERWDVFTVLDAVESTGRHVPLQTPQLSKQDVAKAVDEAVEFISEFSYCEGVEPDTFYEDTSLVGITAESIEAALIEQYRAVWDAWQDVQRNRIEVLAWGSLPLSKACLVFDKDRLVRGPCKRREP